MATPRPSTATPDLPTPEQRFLALAKWLHGEALRLPIGEVIARIEVEGKAFLRQMYEEFCAAHPEPPTAIRAKPTEPGQPR